MDASTTLLALGWGKGALTPSLPAAAAGPGIPQASDEPHRWDSFYRLDVETQAYMTRLGYGPPAGHQPPAAGAQASPGRVSQGGAVDWDTIVAEQNARMGLQPGPNPRGPQRAAAPITPTPQQAGSASWDVIAAEANAKLPPNAVIPGQRGGRQ